MEDMRSALSARVATRTIATRRPLFTTTIRTRRMPRRTRHADGDKFRLLQEHRGVSDPVRGRGLGRQGGLKSRSLTPRHCE
jgi:hypothetical protein